MNVITRGIRNAFRNKIRTFSIVIILGLSVGLALTMLIARQAVTDKMNSVKASVGNTVSVAPAGVRGFEGGGNALNESQVATLSKLSHVASVEQSLNDRLTSSNSSLTSAIDAGSLGQRFAGNNGVSQQAPPQSDNLNGNSSGETRSFTPPVTLIGTTSPTDLSSQQGGGTFKLTSGKTIDGSGSDNVALVGSSLASKNNLKVGSTFKAYDTDIKVVGIFDSDNTFSNNQVIMPLKSVQTLSSQSGAITSIVLNVDSISNVDSVTSAAQKAMGSSADVTNDATRAKEAVEPLQNIQTISLYSLIGTVIAGSVIILLTMIMIVRERRREIGVIKAIGASNVKVAEQFASEAATFTLLGSVIGIVLGVVAANPITHFLVNNSTSSSQGPGRSMGGPVRALGGGISRNLDSISTTVGWNIILYGLLVALVIAVIGSVLASFFIAKIRPAEVMRSE
jgi:putative ABC transport system permease protein